MFWFGQGVRVTFGGGRPTSRSKLSPTHPPCFIDISAMLQSNMADISLPRGEGGGVTVGGQPRRINNAGPRPARPFECLRVSGPTVPGEGSRLGRGVRLQEGWLPASAGMTDGEGLGKGSGEMNSLFSATVWRPALLPRVGYTLKTKHCAIIGQWHRIQPSWPC